MAKTATRRRKAPAKRKSSASSSGAMPWMVIGIAAVGAIAAYDNWKSIRPMLGKAPAAVISEAAEGKPQTSKEAPKQVAVAAPAVKPRQTNDPVPPAAIPLGSGAGGKDRAGLYFSCYPHPRRKPPRRLSDIAGRVSISIASVTQVPSGIRARRSSSPIWSARTWTVHAAKTNGRLPLLPNRVCLRC